MRKPSGEEMSVISRLLFLTLHLYPDYSVPLYSLLTSARYAVDDEMEEWVAPMEGLIVVFSGKRLREAALDPDKAKILSAFLIHAAIHFFRDDFADMKHTAFPEIWNLACDLSINPLLKRSAPKEWEEMVIFPENFGLEDGLTTGEYYQAILKEILKQKAAGGIGGQGEDDQEDDFHEHGSGESESDRESHDGKPKSQASGGSREQDEEDQDQSARGNGKGGRDQGSQKGQPHSHQQNLGWGRDVIVPHYGCRLIPGEPDPGEGISPLPKAVVDQIRISVAKQFRERGNIPAGLELTVEGLLRKPPRSLFDMLSAVIGRLYTRERRLSYMRPSRREGLVPGVVFPGRIRKRAPLIGLVLDTSGSMANDEDLLKIVSITQSVIRKFGRAVVAAVDAEVHVLKEIYRFRPDEILIGGGGTDMALGIEEMEKMRPDIIVVVTDGYTPWPKKQPRVPVVVVLTTRDKLSEVPSWATPIVWEGR